MSRELFQRGISSSAQYTLDNFSARLLVKDVEKQNNVAPGESVTDGFTCIDAFASWSFGFNDSSRLTLSAFARNLTDEASRTTRLSSRTRCRYLAETSALECNLISEASAPVSVAQSSRPLTPLIWWQQMKTSAASYHPLNATHMRGTGSRAISAFCVAHTSSARPTSRRYDQGEQYAT